MDNNVFLYNCFTLHSYYTGQPVVCCVMKVFTTQKFVPIATHTVVLFSVSIGINSHFEGGASPLHPPSR